MVNQPLDIQLKNLIEVLYKNETIKEILENKPFPATTPWYLAGGCITQTVWNFLLEQNITQGIKDYDLIYYNADDITKESEEMEQKRIEKLFAYLRPEVEVTNEARVHTWFEQEFGDKIEQYVSCEDAINHWEVLAASIGINKVNGKINIYAPYGLNDLFGMVMRQNSSVLSTKGYEKKVNKWLARWPSITVIPWN